MEISYKLIENPDLSKSNQCVEITMGPCQGVILEFGEVIYSATFANGKPVPKWRWKWVCNASPAELERKNIYLNIDYITNMKVLKWGVLDPTKVDTIFFKEFTDLIFQKIMELTAKSKSQVLEARKMGLGETAMEVEWNPG